MGDDGSVRRDRTAVLVVDVQNAAVARGPHEGDLVLANIARLVATARRAGIEVIHVQHDDGPGSDFEAGTQGWEIHASVRPAPGEKVVSKRFNSAFRDTELRAYLEEGGIGTLILVGMQTEYCIDTTCRVAFEHGFRVVVPEGTNTTFDAEHLSARQIVHHHNRRIFAGRFAALRPLDETLAAVEDGGGSS